MGRPGSIAGDGGVGRQSLNRPAHRPGIAGCHWLSEAHLHEVRHLLRPVPNDPVLLGMKLAAPRLIHAHRHHGDRLPLLDRFQQPRKRQPEPVPGLRPFGEQAHHLPPPEGLANGPEHLLAVFRLGGAIQDIRAHPAQCAASDPASGRQSGAEKQPERTWRGQQEPDKIETVERLADQQNRPMVGHVALPAPRTQ